MKLWLESTTLHDALYIGISSSENHPQENYKSKKKMHYEKSKQLKKYEVFKLFFSSNEMAFKVGDTYKNTPPRFCNFSLCYF